MTSCMLLVCRHTRSRGGGSSDDPIGAGPVQNLQQLSQDPPDLRSLFWVVDGAEGTGGHAALGFLEGVGGVHQELDGNVSGGERHGSGAEEEQWVLSKVPGGGHSGGQLADGGSVLPPLPPRTQALGCGSQQRVRWGIWQTVLV